MGQLKLLSSGGRLEGAGALRRGELWVYAPGFRHYEVGGLRNSPWDYPAISVTGRGCALMCEHCKGLILRHMIAATTPSELYKACLRACERGARGVLVSGGSDLGGSVPLKPFLPVLKRVRQELGLAVAVHTGLVDREVAAGLAEAEVEAAMLDVVGDAETALKVMHLDAPPEAFERSLRLLKESGVPTVPHVVVGLHYGELRGELRALRMIKGCGPAAVVVVVLTPLPGTGMEGLEPPRPEVAAGVIATARMLMPDVPLALGCARPLGRHRAELDKLALRAGVDAVAFPSEEGLREASRLGLKVSFRTTCCSRLYLDLIEARR